MKVRIEDHIDMMQDPLCQQEWLRDCMHYRGKILKGRYGHWCNEWDALPVDETCDEFPTCQCFESKGAAADAIV